VICIDTSALMALALNEPEADAIAAALGAHASPLISAVTLAEALVVARRRGIGDPMATLLERLSVDVQPVTGATAVSVAAAYEQWGKGVHPAGLNFADCFAYVVAKQNDLGCCRFHGHRV